METILFDLRCKQTLSKKVADLKNPVKFRSSTVIKTNLPLRSFLNLYSKLAKSYFVTVYQLSTSELLWNGLILPLRATQLNVKKNDCHNQPEIKVFESPNFTVGCLFKHIN